MAVDKQLNRLAQYKIDDSFIVSSHIKQKVRNKRTNGAEGPEGTEGTEGLYNRVHVTKMLHSNLKWLQYCASGTLRYPDIWLGQVSYMWV